MNRATVFTILLITLALLSSGCQPILEVDETAYVISLAIDKSNINQVRVGVRIPIPRLVGKIQGQAIGTSAGGQAQDLYLSTSVDAATVLDGIAMMQQYTARRISLEHTRMLLIGEALAREGIEEHVTPIIRFPETRSTMFILIVRGDTIRFLRENRPVLEANLGRFVEMLARSTDATGLSDAIRVGDLYNRLYNTGNDLAIGILSINETVLAARNAKEREQAGGPTAPDASKDIDRSQKVAQHYGEQIPSTPSAPTRTVGSYEVGYLPRQGGNVAEWTGLAIFRSDRMVGEFNGNETIAYRILKGELQQATLTVSEINKPGHLFTVSIAQSRNPIIRTSFKNGRATIDLSLEVEADLITTISPESLETSQQVAKIEKAIAYSLEVWLDSTLQKAQNWGSDVFGFGEHFRRYFLTWQEWTKTDWPEVFKKAEIRYDLSVHIRRPGLIIHTVPAV